jgi:osmoprotectant transport system ATP-binding protein
MTTSALVEFASVNYSINGREILRDFNLALSPGETVVLLGRSGSGKTTALKLVNGLIFPSSGRVLVEGKPTTEWDPVQLKRRIGYVIQESGLFPHFTVAANVGVVPRLAGWPEADISKRVTELLANVGLPAAEFGSRYPRQLSGGQRQRIGVARALAAHPSLLLLDEPFGALDPVTRLDLQRQFLALRETALFVTHDVREALLLGTRIALLREGRLEVLAAPQEFSRSDNPEARAFLEVLNHVV